MSTDVMPSETFVSLRSVAALLGVPAAWLRDEAEAGRVPHLRAGRRFLFNPQATEQALLDRAHSENREREVVHA